MIDLGHNENGDHLYAKQIRQGDRFGLNNCLTHKEPEPMIEFYVEADNKPWFVSRYYMLTLIDKCKYNGLCLCGSTGLSATATQVGKACSVSEARSH